MALLGNEVARECHLQNPASPLFCEVSSSGGGLPGRLDLERDSGALVILEISGPSLSKAAPPSSLAAAHYNTQAIRGCDTSIPKSGILHRALLAAEVDVSQSIALRVAIRPLKVIHQAPGVICAHSRSFGDGARKLCQDLAVKGNTPRDGNAAAECWHQPGVSSYSGGAFRCKPASGANLSTFLRRGQTLSAEAIERASVRNVPSTRPVRGCVLSWRPRVHVFRHYPSDPAWRRGRRS